MTEEDDKDIYYQVVEWLYLNDDSFSNKVKWRAAFLARLKNLLLGEEEKINIKETENE